MVKFWDSFQVYNRHKHDDPSLYGGTNTNIGSNSAQYLQAREVYDTDVKGVPATVAGSIITQVPKRKSSMSSDVTTETVSSLENMDNGENNHTGTLTEGSKNFINKHFTIQNPLEGLDEVTKKQISNMSQKEFQSVYDALKRGEPNNIVNF